jgi:hypothetical protein
MFDENGFRNHRPYTTGASDSENGGDEIDEENNQIAHRHMVQGQKKAGFWQNLIIRHQHVDQVDRQICRADPIKVPRDFECRKRPVPIRLRRQR